MQTVTQTVVYRQNFENRLALQRAYQEEAQEEAVTAVLSIVPSIAAGIPSVKRVYLFGSVIENGRFHKNSDIDIAVEDTTAEAYFEFWRQVEIALPNWLIDVRDITDVSLFATRVRQTGQLIYERTDSSTPS